MTKRRHIPSGRLLLLVAISTSLAHSQTNPTIQQKAESSACSNVVALTGNVAINCSNLTPEERKLFERMPTLINKILANQGDSDVLMNVLIKKVDEMQAISASLKFERAVFYPSEACGDRAIAPRGSMQRFEAEQSDQLLRSLAPGSGGSYCLKLIFLNNGTLPISNVLCRAGISLDYQPKFPPDHTLSDVTVGMTLYATPYKTLVGPVDETQPGVRIACSTPVFPGDTARQVMAGTMALVIYGVAKYQSASIPAGMIGVTEVGQYFINSFDSSRPAGRNRVAVVPNK